MSWWWIPIILVCFFAVFLAVFAVAAVRINRDQP